MWSSPSCLNWQQCKSAGPPAAFAGLYSVSYQAVIIWSFFRHFDSKKSKWIFITFWLSFRFDKHFK
jgi:hypothetical protein